MTPPSTHDSPFAARVRRFVEHFGQQTAFLFEEQSFDWACVGLMRGSIEQALRAGGVDADAPVGVVLRERPSTCAALLAVLASGRPAVLLSSHLPDEALRDDLMELRLPLLVADTRDWQRAGLPGFAAEMGTIGLEVHDAPQGCGATVVAEAKPSERPGIEIQPGTAVLVLTSGTTGRPRRIPVDFAALEAARERVTVLEPSSARGVTINVLPLTTIGGVRGIADTVWRGRPLALMERFDIWQWARLVRDHRPKRIGIPPAALRTMLDEKVPHEWFEGVECMNTGSAPLHVPTVRAFVEAYGIPVLNAYGSTEFGGRIAEWRLPDWDRWHTEKLGSVGRPMSHAEVHIVDPGDGHELPVGAVGLLEVRVGGAAGLIRTNDLARLDDDGFLWLEGRADDVIIRGGFKVPVGEVEAALEAHPSVEEAIVVGLDDERLGQVPAGVVTLRDGAIEPSSSELVEWVRSRLVPYKAPRTVLVVDVVPRNEMMKPLRREVREVLAAHGASADRHAV